MKLNKNDGVDIQKERLTDKDEYIKELFSQGKIRPVENEKEFWEEYKKDKKRIKKLFRSSYKMMNDPYTFLNKYENILAEMEFKGVVSSGWVQGQRERLYRELNKPQEFKAWVTKTKENILKKKDGVVKRMKEAGKRDKKQ